MIIIYNSIAHNFCYAQPYQYHNNEHWSANTVYFYTLCSLHNLHPNMVQLNSTYRINNPIQSIDLRSVYFEPSIVNCIYDSSSTHNSNLKTVTR